MPLGSFNVDLMNAFQQKLGYDLIILQFGTNVLNYGSLNYSWYERKMTSVVKHVKECFPGAAIAVARIFFDGARDLNARTPVRWGGREYLLEPTNL